MNISDHKVTLWGNEYTIGDCAWSSTTKFVERDINDDTQGCKNLSPAPKVILDIGANIGMWTIAMANRYPEAFIYAVEPAPYNVLNLQRNLRLSNLESRTKVIHSAVHSEKGTITLWQHPVNSGSASMFSGVNVHVPVSVPAMTLDELIETTGPIDLLKMDIEGSEYSAFKSFTKWDKVKRITIEMHYLPLINDDPNDADNQAPNEKLQENFADYLQKNVSPKDLFIYAQRFSLMWGERVNY